MSSSIGNFFKSWDATPHAITFRYNRKKNFPTVASGIWSIVGDLMITYWIVTTFLETR